MGVTIFYFRIGQNRFACLTRYDDPAIYGERLSENSSVYILRGRDFHGAFALFGRPYGLSGDFVF